MKLVKFKVADDIHSHIGLVHNLLDSCSSSNSLEVIDLTASISGAEPIDLLVELRQFGPDSVESAARKSPHLEILFDDLRSPLTRPGKFLAIGYNYRAHADEVETAISDFPLFFNKQISCISGPRAPIIRPQDCSKLDYEGELAFVIGERCSHVSPDEAPSKIAAWLVCNDISARDWQRQSPTITLGKSYDSFGPIGPWLVTPDEVNDPHMLTIRTTVNDEVRQNGSTSEMICNVFEQIAVLSTRCTLEPGDLVTTGSPAGSAQGREPSPWLTPGDLVRVEIESVGSLENRVIEPASVSSGRESDQ